MVVVVVVMVVVGAFAGPGLPQMLALPVQAGAAMVTGLGGTGLGGTALGGTLGTPLPRTL